MTPTKKLKRMIERAVSEGWNMYPYKTKRLIQWKIENNQLYVHYGRLEPDYITLSPSDIIFSEKFGKAVWGSEGCEICKRQKRNIIKHEECPPYIYEQRNLIPFKDDTDLINKAYKSIFGGER